MERQSSGSLDYNMINDIEEYVNTPAFESNLRISFSDKLYFLNSKAPNPFWVYSTNSHMLIRINRDTELLLLEELDADQGFVACLALQNFVKIPVEYVTEVEWH